MLYQPVYASTNLYLLLIINLYLFVVVLLTIFNLCFVHVTCDDPFDNVDETQTLTATTINKNCLSKDFPFSIHTNACSKQPLTTVVTNTIRIKTKTRKENDSPTCCCSMYMASDVFLLFQS